jgi:hypothetical protein
LTIQVFCEKINTRADRKRAEKLLNTLAGFAAMGYTAARKAV